MKADCRVSPLEWRRRLLDEGIVKVDAGEAQSVGERILALREELAKSLGGLIASTPGSRRPSRLRREMWNYSSSG